MRPILLSTVMTGVLLGAAGTFSAQAAPALAQPPSDAPADPPAAEILLGGQLCLTNACGGRVVDFSGQTRARSVAEAIALGNAQQVKELGGTGADAAQALARRAAARVEAASPGEREGRALGAANYAAFADLPSGGSLIWGTSTEPPAPNPPPGVTFTGVTIRREPDGGQAFLTSDGGALLFFGAPAGGQTQRD